MIATQHLADRAHTIVVVIAAQPLADRTNAMTVVVASKLKITHRRKLTRPKPADGTVHSVEVGGGAENPAIE